MKFTRIRLAGAAAAAALALTLSPVQPLEAAPAAPAAPAVPNGVQESQKNFIMIGYRLYDHPATSTPNTACWHFFATERFTGYVPPTEYKKAQPGFGTDVCWRNYVVIPWPGWYCTDVPGGAYRLVGYCSTSWTAAGGPTRRVNVDYDYESYVGGHPLDIDILNGTFQVQGGNGIFSGTWKVS